jgi:tRNA U34 5-methylaminomethyl-2-thiouridine-forming methyltransferase MnmC
MDGPPAFPETPTADGSQTFYSPEFGEWFHSKAGAYGEARQTYIQATDLVNRARSQGAIALLDVCYGLGYNTAAALEALMPYPDVAVHLIGLELDRRVPQAAIAQGLLAQWPPSVQQALHTLATVGTIQVPNLQAQVHWGDARQQIQTVAASGFQADVIFLDPFSPPRCPQLWTVEFLTLVARCLKPDGLMATYSCAAAVRAALQDIGLRIGANPIAGRRWPGTLATFGPAPLLPLSQQEQEHLDTRAAVPYRDPTLQDDAVTLQQRRQAEQRTAHLKPTGEWRKRWL